MDKKTTVLKNAGVTLITQIINLFLKFVLQKVFIDTLGVSYLGYNSVFTNILQMLNLADLGIGVAITGFLYKPIANDEKKTISALMYLYRRIYYIMGTIVAAIGGIVLIFLPIIIPDAGCTNTYLRVLFLINLIGTISTYFMAYNRTLLIAQQKAYFVNLLDMITNFVFTLFQIISLLLFNNYIIFLLLNVTKNIISNIIITIDCNKNNTYLRTEVDKKIYSEYKEPIIVHMKNIFVSKIGAYVYYGTDNIIISIFKGSLLAGYLANYTLVVTAVQGIVSSIFSAVQANFGNRIVTTKDVKKQKNLADIYLFLNYLFANMCLVCCMFLFQPFIRLYIGEKYLLDFSTVVFLSVNLLLSIMLLVPSQLFIIYKLFVYDKKIIAVSALLNIIISVVLVRRVGINGVLVGTLVTSIIYLGSRMFIVSKYAFYTSFKDYLFKMLLWCGESIITICIVSIVEKNINPQNWIEFVLFAIFTCFVSITVPILLSINNKEIKQLRLNISLRIKEYDER